MTYELLKAYEEDNARLTAERDSLKAKVEADADVMAVCEHLLEENRSEAELVAELAQLRAEVSRWKDECSVQQSNDAVSQTQLRELREAAEALRVKHGNLADSWNDVSARIPESDKEHYRACGRHAAHDRASRDIEDMLAKVTP